MASLVLLVHLVSRALQALRELKVLQARLDCLDHLDLAEILDQRVSLDPMAFPELTVPLESEGNGETQVLRVWQEPRVPRDHQDQ